MGKTGLVYHSAYLEHDMGAGHPESPHRLKAIMQQLERSGTAARLTRIEPRKAEEEWITQIHSPSYVAALNAHQPTNGRVALDPDTSMSPGSLRAAFLAAGGALTAVDAIMRGEVEHVFCAVRPPGHRIHRNPGPNSPRHATPHERSASAGRLLQSKVLPIASQNSVKREAGP